MQNYNQMLSKNITTKVIGLSILEWSFILLVILLKWATQNIDLFLPLFRALNCIYMNHIHDGVWLKGWLQSTSSGP